MRAAAASGVALAVLLAGCSDAGDEGSASAPSTPAAGPPSASGTTSAAPAPEDVAEDVPEPPEATDDRQGRVAFARYVLQAWIHALNTNDPQPLLDLGGARPCTGCGRLAGELAERTEEGWSVVLRDVRVSGAEVTRDGSRSRVRLSVAIPESTTVHDDGTFRSTNPAHPRSTFEVTMQRRGERFRLVGFALY